MSRDIREAASFKDADVHGLGWAFCAVSSGHVHLRYGRSIPTLQIALHRAVSEREVVAPALRSARCTALFDVSHAELRLLVVTVPICVFQKRTAAAVARDVPLDCIKWPSVLRVERSYSTVRRNAWIPSGCEDVAWPAASGRRVRCRERSRLDQCCEQQQAFHHRSVRATREHTKFNSLSELRTRAFSSHVGTIN